MFSGDYGWMPKKDIKPRVKLFADDDFKFFVFMSIFIFCLAGLVLLITGDDSHLPSALKVLAPREKWLQLLSITIKCFQDLRLPLNRIE